MVRPTIYKPKMRLSNRTAFEIGERADEAYYERNKHDYPEYVSSKQPFTARHGPAKDSLTSEANSRRMYSKRGLLFQLLQTKDDQEKAVIQRIVAAIKYMYRMKPSVEFRTINEMYLRLIYDFF